MTLFFVGGKSATVADLIYRGIVLIRGTPPRVSVRVQVDPISGVPVDSSKQ